MVPDCLTVAFPFLLTGPETVYHRAIPSLVVSLLQSWSIHATEASSPPNPPEVSPGLFQTQTNLPFDQNRSFRAGIVRHLLSRIRYTVSLIGHYHRVSMSCQITITILLCHRTTEYLLSEKTPTHPRVLRPIAEHQSYESPTSWPSESEGVK